MLYFFSGWWLGRGDYDWSLGPETGEVLRSPPPGWGGVLGGAEMESQDDYLWVWSLEETLTWRGTFQNKSGNAQAEIETGCGCGCEERERVQRGQRELGIKTVNIQCWGLRNKKMVI